MTAPYAGLEYGDVDLSTLFFGSGGGGVWNGGTNSSGESPGPGGDGGGILFLGASALQVDGAGGLNAVGGTTFAWAAGTWTYGAGGGAGGSVFVQADTVTLAVGAIEASGGFGQDDYIRAGGDGGEGRVRIDYGTANGFTFGSPEADDALDVGSEPDAGFAAALP